MLEALNVLDLAQAGAVAILLVIVVNLWARLNALTDRFITYMERSAERGDIAAAQMLDEREREKRNA